MLVDDDDGVRRMLEDSLSEAGFEVIPAPDTVIARRQLEQNPAVDLCVVDIVMPAGVPDGAAFAQSLKGDKPGVPVILMTGYYAAGKRAERAADSLIYKPFGADTLVAEIRRQLAKAPMR